MTYYTSNDVIETIQESKQRPQAIAVIQLAIEYARLRVDHLTAPPEKQATVSAHRSRVHNALIRACDELAEAMEVAHEDARWRETLGNDRKDIGDFACFVHCILGIAAR